MTTVIILWFILFSRITVSYADDSINLLVQTSMNSTIRRYCVELARLPNGHTINVTDFGWHIPFVASSSVNACNISSLTESLPAKFPPETILILYEHSCKMTVHAWNVETLFGPDISLMVLTNRTNTHYELTFNTTIMPVSIPVLVFLQSNFDKINRTYNMSVDKLQMTINYGPYMPKKFRPAVLLIFLLVLLILVAGNCWAADEFRHKILNHGTNTLNDLSRANPATTPNESQDSAANKPLQTSATSQKNADTSSDKQSSQNNEPAILYMPYCIIGFILLFAVGWLLLIYYFPKVMIYVLQAFFCIGAFTSLTTCLNRLSYFMPILRRFSIPSYTCHKPCTCKLGPFNVFNLSATILSLTLVIVWYVCRQADWAWILQDLLGAAICITVVSVYRLGNMRVITLILLGFFVYDVFFVFITPYIPIFQSSDSKTTTTTMVTTTLNPFTTRPGINSYNVRTIAKVARNPSVMEQVALGIGADGEIVPLLFVLPLFIPDSEMDPCITTRKSMLGFGDIILPGILLTFCKIFDVAVGNRWPIYYFQSLIAYFIGLLLTHVALYLMNTAQPALLYLVPCILLSTILTGICRGELRELYTGKRIQSLLENKPHVAQSSLLNGSDHSTEEQTNQSNDVLIGVGDAGETTPGMNSR